MTKIKPKAWVAVLEGESDYIDHIVQWVPEVIFSETEPELPLPENPKHDWKNWKAKYYYWEWWEFPDLQKYYNGSSKIPLTDQMRREIGIIDSHKDEVYCVSCGEVILKSEAGDEDDGDYTCMNCYNQRAFTCEK